MGNNGKQFGELTVRKNTELQKILDFSYINYITFSLIGQIYYRKNIFFLAL